MRKLDILVPMYNEGEEVVKPLLDSIAVQQNVDLENDVGVIICCDGGSTRITDEFKARYPFPIEFHECQHRGVSATRNSCMDFSSAEYVMFCDCDDMFCNVCGLWIIFREIKNGGFDSLVSVFLEETRMPAQKNTDSIFGSVFMNAANMSGLGSPDGKEVTYINREQDSTFVHGKVHRRQYLIDQKIRWNDSLTIHEDSFFNILCQNLSQNVKYCPMPFYLWKWRDDSVCRHDPKYILKTYNNMLDSNTALVREFMSRGMTDKAMFYAAFMIFDAYYTMNKEEWLNQENQEYRHKTELRFQKYYKDFKGMWDLIPLNDKMMISNSVRQRSVMEGMRMEAVTIDDWLKHIEKLKK